MRFVGGMILFGAEYIPEQIEKTTNRHTVINIKVLLDMRSSEFVEKLNFYYPYSRWWPSKAL